MSEPYRIPEEEIYRIARRNVERKKGAQIHLTVYIIVNMFLCFVWFGGRLYIQMHLALAGVWAVGVIAHFLIAYLFEGGDKWDREAIEKEADRLRSRIKDEESS